MCTKKKIWGITLVVLFFVNLFLGAMSAEVSAEIIYQAYETYEDVSVGPLNSPLNNYHHDQSNGTRAIVYDPAGGFNKVLKYSKTVSGSFKTIRWYNGASSGTFVTQFRARIDDFSSSWGLLLRADPYDEKNWITIKKEGNNDFAYLYAYNKDWSGIQNTGKIIKKNTWYTYSLVTNRGTNTYEVYVDGEKVGEDYQLDNIFAPPEGRTINGLVFNNGEEDIGSSLFIDDFRIYQYTGELDVIPPTQSPEESEPKIVFWKDTFESLTVSDENLSRIDWYHFDQNDGTRKAVQDPHNGNNKVVKLTKTGNNLKTLRWYEPRPTGLFTTELKVMFDSFDSQWALQFRMYPFQEYDIVAFEKDTGVVRIGGVNSSKVLELNKWYTVSMEVNTDKNTCRVFIDGVQIGSTVALPDSFKDSGKTYHAFSMNNNYGGTSSMYIDDVTAYQGEVNPITFVIGGELSNNSGTVNVIVCATNTSPYNDVHGLIIVALYDSNGTLVDMEYISQVFAAGESKIIPVPFSVSESTAGYKVKAMIWDGMDNIKPLGVKAETSL